MVVQNRSLVEMIRMRPVNQAELICVWGMGAVRVRAEQQFFSLNFPGSWLCNRFSSGREIWSDPFAGMCWYRSRHDSYMIPTRAMLDTRATQTRRSHTRCKRMRRASLLLWLGHGRVVARGAQALHEDSRKDLLRTGPRPILDSKARRHTSAEPSCAPARGAVSRAAPALGRAVRVGRAGLPSNVLVQLLVSSAVVLDARVQPSGSE